MEILIFIIGAFMGSVVNALAYRLPRNIAWTRGRSICPKCKHELAWSDLIPLLSYLFLGGKCRYCKKVFGIRYLIVELIMAFGFVVINSWFIAPISVILMGLMTVTMIIAVMDLETQLIADTMVILWGVLVVSYKFFTVGWAVDWINTVLAIAAGVGLIGGIWLFSKKQAMGEGDIGVAAVMGLWLGFGRTMVALWLAFVLGGLVGLGVVLSRRGGLKTKIAFGPFLVAGSWAAFWFGDILIKWTGL